MSGQTRVVVADDQRVVREGLTALLGLIPEVVVVGTAADGDEAVAVASRTGADVVLMDLAMPRCDGVEATRRLREASPASRVVVLTTYAEDSTVVAAIRAGARGYLTKDSGIDELSAALDAVMAGRAAIDPTVQHHVLRAASGGSRDESTPPDGLTAREAEVLALIAEGLSNAEIADRLTISGATVKSHVNRLLSKTGCRDRAQAVAYAYRNGLAPGGSSG
jgi:DNA-binding NarL/FixJ family response regulator